MKKQQTIIFITGAFVHNSIWEPWINFFTEKGFNAIAPAWPHKQGALAELKQSLPDNKAFSSLHLSDLIAYYEKIAKEQPEKPIVTGHAMGGLIAQILVNRNVVAAGVALHSVPPKGVFSFEWSFLKSVWKPIGFLPFGKKVFMMEQKEWNYSFANGLSAAEQQATYEQYCVPESRQILRDALTDMAKIDFIKQHPPLLFITGTDDRITPNSLNYENYARYLKDHSITDYKEFSNRNHLSIALPGWQQQAEYIIDWIEIHSLS